jgi:organic radical activating enzyme
VGVDDFNSFHNTPLKLQDREKMLRGEWPGRGCEYCRDLEQSGKYSDRTHHLQVPYMSPPELDNDPTATSVTPRVVEVYFDNVCNMSCIYCWDGFSSKIQQENKKFGRFEKNGVVIDNHANIVPHKKQLTEKFWQWMTENGPQLRRFHVLGGEPFYQLQFEECLNFFENTPCPALEFNVISNLKIESSKLSNILVRIKKLQDEKKIRRFDLTASIDCLGKEQEYVRYGISIDQWKQNFQLVAEQSWIYLNINQTLSSLTLKTTPDLLAFINQLRKNREINHFFSPTLMTSSSEMLHPGIFGPHFFQKDFDAILEQMPENTWQQQESKKFMASLIDQLNLIDRDEKKILQLTTFLDEIDRRRNLNWKETFPWLEKEITNVV